VLLASDPAVINYGPGGQYENVFVRGTDGKLYADSFDPVVGWGWSNLGNPAGVQLASDPTVINYGDSGQYENVFVRGSNGNLYQDYFVPGTGWTWSNLGNPATALVGSPAVINYGSGGQYENVFLMGADGKLYYDSYDPAVGWQWSNVNGETARVGDILRGSNASAQVGLYLKQVGGPVLADLQGGVQFEPASMIKVLLLTTALEQVQKGNLHLTDMVNWYYKPGDNINNPTKGNPGVNPDSFSDTAANQITEPLGEVLDRMMKVSDNRCTRAIDKLLGRPLINATAQQLGMTSTVFASTEGSGIPGNFLTLHDAGLLYEKVESGQVLTGQYLTDFRTLMTSELTSGDPYGLPFNSGVFASMITVVQQEVALKLGKSTSDPAVVNMTNAFVALMKNNWKGGGYDLYNNQTADVDRTVGGWVQLPFKTNGQLTPRSYVYGVFIDNAVVPLTVQNGQTTDAGPALNAVNNAWGTAQGELLRLQIRAALATW
jgi:hypothetical protein